MMVLVFVGLLAVSACQDGAASEVVPVEDEVVVTAVTEPIIEPIKPTATVSASLVDPAPILPRLDITAADDLVHVFYEGFVLTAAGEAGLLVRPLDDYDAETALSGIDMVAWDVVVHGQRAYVLGCQRDCVQVVDLSEPQAPVVRNKVYATGRSNPVDKILAAEDLLYLVVAGEEVQLLNYNLERVTAVPFAEQPVVDLVETLFADETDEDARQLNLTVANQGIYGITVPKDNPAAAQRVGFEEALRPEWHEPEPGSIESLVAVEDIMLGAAGERGVRSYIRWSRGSLWENEFYTVRGRALDLVYDDLFLYVLSEDESEQILTTFFFEPRQEGLVNADVWRVDEISFPVAEMAEIRWYGGQLWSVSPRLQPIKGLKPRRLLLLHAATLMEAAQKEAAQAIEPPDSFQRRVVYDGRIGGEQRVVAQLDDFIYVAIGYELLAYKAAEGEEPILMNRLIFNQQILQMHHYENRALLITRGFESGTVFTLDLSTPIYPQVIQESRGSINYSEQWGPLVFLDRGYAQTFIDIVDLSASDTGFSSMIRQTAFDRIQQLSSTYADDFHEIDSYALQGDILALDWSSFFGCLPNASDYPCHAGVLVLDLSDLERPQIISSFFEPDEPTRIGRFEEQGQLTLQAVNKQERIIDLTGFVAADAFLSEPELPLFEQSGLISVFGTKSLSGIAINEDLAYISADKTLYVVDLALMPEMRLVYMADLEESIEDMVVFGHYLIGKSAFKIDVYDLRNGPKPLLVRTIDYSPASQNPFFLQSAQYFLHGSNRDLHIERVIDGALEIDPNQVVSASIKLPGDMVAPPAVYGRYVYQSIRTEQEESILLVIDLQDFENPQIVGSIDELKNFSRQPDFRMASIIEGQLIVRCSYGPDDCVFDIETNPAQPQFLYDYRHWNALCGAQFARSDNADGGWDDIDYRHNEYPYYYPDRGEGSFRPEMVPANLCFEVYGSWIESKIALYGSYMFVARDSRGLLVFRNEPWDGVETGQLPVPLILR